MSQDTIHSGKSRRGVVLAVIVLVCFVIGAAMLGNGSSPDATPGATATD